MAEQQLPVWNSEGIEPPANLQIDGWQPGVKPPAQYFDWLFNRAYKCLEELQTITEALETNKANGEDLTMLNNKVTQHLVDETKHVTSSERTKWNNKLDSVPDASTTQKGITQLVDSYSSTSTTTAVTPNALKQVNDAAVIHMQNDTVHLLQNGGFLNGAVDYNSLLVNRLYQVGTTTGSNYPPPEPYGILLQLQPLNTGFAFQLYFCVTSGNLYTRVYGNTAWTSWALR